MADKKISELGAGAPALATDAIPVQRGAGNVKLTVGDVSALSLPIGGGDLTGALNLSGALAPTAPTVALGEAGVLNGACVYRVSYYTLTGDSALSPNSLSINPSSQRVTVTFPVSSNALVTGRKIWRSKVGDTTRTFLVTTIENNTETTYDDNIADGSLGIESHYLLYSLGTSPPIKANGHQVFRDRGLNLYIGQDAGILQEAGAYYNTVVGSIAGIAITTGWFNTFIGGGSGNVATTGAMNTCVGMKSGFGIIDGNYNTLIGTYSGRLNNGSGNIFIGSNSGYYETGSNTLLIDNAERTNEADARLKCLVYGTFAAAVADQRFNIHALVGINTNAPATNLDVVGVIRVTGSSGSIEICDQTNGVDWRWAIASYPINAIESLTFRSIGAGAVMMSLSREGKLGVGIGVATPTSTLQVAGLAEHADNAAAVGAGLTAGAFYRTADVVKVVHA